ncbi:MAG: NTP transferase domain-containing protein, partial [Nitrospiraceae bacterium]
MNNRQINIFILAAGRGERLRPITDSIPKPLVPLLGRPALEYILDGLTGLPYKKIGINLHHRKEDMGKWAAGHPLREKMILFYEDEVLGTGGALKKAGEFLGSATFLVHNSDILSDIDLEDLLETHRTTGNLVTLAVHDEQKFNSLLIDDRGCLLKVLNSQDDPSHAARPPVRILAFTGIAVYEPAFLAFLPEGRSGVVEAWTEAARAGHAVGTFDVTGCSWTDIGTPVAYAAAVFDALRKEGEVIYLHRSVENCGYIDLKRNVVLEQGCHVRERVKLRNCIVLPGGTVPPPPSLTTGWQTGDTSENCIVGPGFVIPLSERDVILSDTEGRQLIGTGGSDRRYYRTTWEGG